MTLKILKLGGIDLVLIERHRVNLESGVVG